MTPTTCRRRVIVDPKPGRVEAAVEDDFHRFRVFLDHADGRVTAIQGTTERFPWATCPAATEVLAARLVGAPLAEAARTDDASQHCTHLFDLFLAAANHAYDGARSVFDLTVPDRVDGKTEANIRCNGRLLLSWSLDGLTITGPARFAGLDLRRLSQWIGRLSTEEQEAARMLRRAILISGGRDFDFESVPHAGAIPQQRGACYTFQPERSAQGTRIKGAIRDFSDHPEKLLSEDPL